MNTPNRAIGADVAGSLDSADYPARVITAGGVTARFDRLPMTATLWKLLTLVALGGFFELYDVYFAGYIAPGLFRSGILTATTPTFFAMNGLAGFLASLFIGLFIGTICFGSLADRFGRRRVFAASMLWYCIATVFIAFQDTALGLNVWRVICGIGVGVQYVTIDSYVSELTPRHARGMAFGLVYGVAQICAPLIAFLAWVLVPISPLGFEGWRWVIALGSVGALLVWYLQLRLPESPRWLVQKGRLDEAERVMQMIETRVRRDYGKDLPPPADAPEAEEQEGTLREAFSPRYRGRTLMLVVVNFFQTIGYYGFVSWIPTLLIAKGIMVTRSLEYTFLIVLLYPIAPFIVMLVADRFERKWQLVCSAISVAVIGVIFSMLKAPGWLIAVGIVQTLVVNWLSTIVHTYQAELFPTRMRAGAVGFVYSWSRLSSIFVGFFIAFFLREFGVPGVFAFIFAAMAIVVVAVALFGPRTTGLALDDIAR
ncbi:MFS transporter [Caballeronia sp. HLA56]|jgi:putative MFS transporter